MLLEGETGCVTDLREEWRLGMWIGLRERHGYIPVEWIGLDSIGFNWTRSNQVRFRLEAGIGIGEFPRIDFRQGKRGAGSRTFH